LLNHLIAEELPAKAGEGHISNSDPITGQAGWYDVRVRVYKAASQEPKVTSPQFHTVKPAPGMMKRAGKWLAFRGGSGLFKKLLPEGDRS